MEQSDSDYVKLGSDGSRESSISVPSISDESHLRAQQYRGQSLFKWLVLCQVFFSWTSAYFLTFCASALETTLLDVFNWNSSYFSYIVASTFLGAIIGPFCLPFFDGFKHKVNVCTLFNNQIILFIGQLSFALLLNVYRIDQSAVYFALICFTRFIIGIGMGSTDALAQSTINFWFGASESINEAFGILMIGIEIGTLTSRLAFPPFYSLFNDGDDHKAIALPFLLALFFPILAITINAYVNRKLKRTKRFFPEYFVEEAHSEKEYDSVSNVYNFSKIKQITNLSFTVWLVITIVVLVNVIINVLYGCFEDPLHENFKFSEYDADMILSLTGLSVIIFAFPAAFIMDYCGGPIYWYLGAAVMITVSMGLLSFSDLFVDGTVKQMNMFGIVSICGFSIVLPFAIVIFTLQAIVSPPQYAELIASISTCLWWTLSIIMTNVFGWVHDELGSYSYSILAMFGIGTLTLIVGILLFVVDKCNGGVLSQCNTKKKGANRDVKLTVSVDSSKLATGPLSVND